MNIPFRIESISTRQFALFPDKFENGRPVSLHSEFRFGLDKEHSRIECVAHFSYMQGEKLLLTAEIACIFGIHPDGMKQLLEASRIPASYLQYLASIVTGTARGVIHTRTEGTVLNPVVLPQINLTELIKEDFQLP